jgi:regulatory protein YycI of two-component signal transduction system YycFG
MTCSSVDNLNNFSPISNDCTLSTKVTKDDFEKYMNRIINSGNDYNIVVGNFFY